jgi:hypothetical protein
VYLHLLLQPELFFSPALLFALDFFLLPSLQAGNFLVLEVYLFAKNLIERDDPKSAAK